MHSLGDMQAASETAERATAMSVSLLRFGYHMAIGEDVPGASQRPKT
jgi:hypothetical protein